MSNKILTDAAKPLGTLTVSATVVAAASSPVLTTHNLTSATAGVVNVFNALAAHINIAVLQFSTEEAADADAGNIKVYAGKADGQDFKLVFAADLLAGTRFKSATETYVDTAVLTAGEAWGTDEVKVIGNALDDIVQIAFDLHGYDHLFFVCDEADTTIYLTGF